MNETITPNPAEFDALAQARRDADPQVKLYHEFMGKPGEIDPAAAEDMVNYLESRPTEAGEAADHYADTMDESTYEDLSMIELAKHLGDAELAHDKTKEDDIMDVLMQKIDDFTAHTANARGPRTDIFTEDKDGNVNDPALNWLDKMLAVKDKYKAERLAAAQPRAAADAPNFNDENIVGWTGEDGQRQVHFENSFEREELAKLDDALLSHGLGQALKGARQAYLDDDIEAATALQNSAVNHLNELHKRDNYPEDELNEYREGINRYILEGDPDDRVQPEEDDFLFGASGLAPLQPGEQPKTTSRWERIRHPLRSRRADNQSANGSEAPQGKEKNHTARRWLAIGVGAVALGLGIGYVGTNVLSNDEVTETVDVPEWAQSNPNGYQDLMEHGATTEQAMRIFENPKAFSDFIQWVMDWKENHKGGSDEQLLNDFRAGVQAAQAAQAAQNS